jgi:hypothetical protein
MNGSAVAHPLAGDVEDAVRLYRAVLAADPPRADALRSTVQKNLARWR